MNANLSISVSHAGRIPSVCRAKLVEASHAIHQAQASAGSKDSRDLVKKARFLIGTARTLYARFLAMMARHAALSHHYVRAGERFRAELCANGQTVWTSIRTYGKRQSAQRAAARHVEKLRMSAACAGATA